MTGRLAGRVAVVTGAADGIGAGIARAYAAEGARVLVADVSEDRGRALAGEIDGLFLRVDITDRDQVEAMVATAVDDLGAIDVLVNNAWGAGDVGRVENKTDAMLERGFAMGYYGPFWAMRAAFGHMKAAGWGRIINMCSLNGVNAHVGTLEYNSAKEALRTLTRTAAREWAPTGVVVNAICPGARSAAFHRMAAAHPEIAATAEAANPMGRLGDPLTDIAPIAVFLASEDCRYLTGNTLYADGGSHINGVAWAPDLP
ncbi:MULTISPECIES: SDR family NAD(P)-dependent oxidoreductase [unclassified Nocardioides]|uniref:SDR family NAD(P)-dependent oxidoreductase n=1 Tax=unclassified Nocardioides TaxID=2615069 RepID=UPI0006F75941|nr:MULTISPECIES: SDR family oxidoreductase [unclassified Nocardioides]KRA29522.1 oxidoreductase [Nocardioides sp. Root614]KRA88303.1 oxidoreductase [Nocardioides sp. Root682]